MKIHYPIISGVYRRFFSENPRKQPDAKELNVLAVIKFKPLKNPVHAHLAWATLARGCLFFVVGGPMYDASSSSEVRHWFLSQTGAVTFSDCDSAPVPKFLNPDLDQKIYQI